MEAIKEQLNKRRKYELAFVKESVKKMEEFVVGFNNEDRFNKLKLAYDLNSSHFSNFGIPTDPDPFLLDLYNTDIKFRVICDRLFEFLRETAKRQIAHKKELLQVIPDETRLYEMDDSFALNLLDDYRMVYGSPLHKELFEIDIKQFFTTKKINEWLNTTERTNKWLN